MKKIIGYICFVAIALITGIIMVGAAGGDSSDPVISKSYYDQNWNALKTDLEKKIDSAVMGDFTFAQPDLTKAAYKGVSVATGKKVILNAGSELIVCTGSAKALTKTATSAGLRNTVKGVALKRNQSVPKNIILISTGNDGRGLTVTATAAVYIRGPYTIK